VTDAPNISMFLTDPRLRNIPAGSVMIADEASMVTMGHWDALTQLARQAGAMPGTRTGAAVRIFVRSGEISAGRPRPSSPGGRSGAAGDEPHGVGNV
jgi:hypothetical protein